MADEVGTISTNTSLFWASLGTSFAFLSDSPLKRLSWIACSILKLGSAVDVLGDPGEKPESSLELVDPRSSDVRLHGTLEDLLIDTPGAPEVEIELLVSFVWQVACWYERDKDPDANPSYNGTDLRILEFWGFCTLGIVTKFPLFPP